MLKRDFTVQIVDGRRLGPLEQSDFHVLGVNQPGRLPLVKYLESEDLLVLVERSLKVRDSNGEVVDKVDLH